MKVICLANSYKHKGYEKYTSFFSSIPPQKNQLNNQLSLPPVGVYPGMPGARRESIPTTGSGGVIEDMFP